VKRRRWRKKEERRLRTTKNPLCLGVHVISRGEGSGWAVASEECVALRIWKGQFEHGEAALGSQTWVDRHGGFHKFYSSAFCISVAHSKWLITYSAKSPAWVMQPIVVVSMLYKWQPWAVMERPFSSYWLRTLGRSMWWPGKKKTRFIWRPDARSLRDKCWIWCCH